MLEIFSLKLKSKKKEKKESPNEIYYTENPSQKDSGGSLKSRVLWEDLDWKWRGEGEGVRGLHYEKKGQLRRH